jgi:CHAD domain-containing protein
MNQKLKLLHQTGTEREPREVLHFGAWRGQLEDCLRKPKKKSVHGLRVATLRLGAEVEQRLESQKPVPTSHAAKRWQNQAKKLRHALGGVREIDVHLAKLDGLRETLAPTNDYMPRSSRQSERRIAALERTLKQDRRAAAKALSATIEARFDRLLGASRALEAELRSQSPVEKMPEAHSILSMVGKLASDFPSLDTNSLHDFRKRVKKVRYQADLLASSDPALAALAGVLKRMQDAIGEWHDWQALAKLARKLVGHSDSGGLQEMLATMADTSLEKALSFCARELAHFQRASSGASGAAIAKIPIRRVEASSAPSARCFA